MELNTSLLDFPGIGSARAKALARLGLNQAGDLLGYLPRAYEDRTKCYPILDAPPDIPVCVVGMVAGPPKVTYLRKGLDITKVKVVDDQTAMTVTFFNQDYVRTSLVTGKTYIFYGKLDRVNGYPAMTNPLFESEEHPKFTGRIVPIYPLTAGVSNHLLGGLVRQALPDCAPLMEEKLPHSVVASHGLMELESAYSAIHYPEDPEDLEKARRRFIFQELFTLSVGMALLKRRRAGVPGQVFRSVDLEEFYATLPFQLTQAQKRTIAEAAQDCQSGRPMNRLVQGDVGSGKTVVAAACGFLAHRSGYQTAMMAPTEILAEQHFKTLTGLLAPSGLTVGLLTGSMKIKEKRGVYVQLEAGEIDFVVGTHALLSQGVTFRKLGLVVTDEQHRFGVEQRAALAAKAGELPHLLVMSATPIPRTLALIIYGDLDVSVIDELPPGRMPIKTLLVGSDKRQRMYGFVRDQVAEGRQVYIICPAVEENPDSQWDLKSVTAYAQELQTVVFPQLQVGFVHGKLKPKEKETAMAAFARGETQVLVATTVVEVGVDVPNANLIIIENADRYGLSQLHQLRGRVGRGQHQSWCVLVSDNRNPDTRLRLKALVESTDGFVIAQTDLELRGPGDFFGQRQHGLPALHVADLNADTRVLKETQDAAQALLDADPRLEDPEHAVLVQSVQALFDDNPEMFN